MITLQINPSFTLQAGNLSLSGVVSSSTSEVKWGLITDSSPANTDGVTQTGTDFEINVIVPAGVSSIKVQAFEGAEESNYEIVNLTVSEDATLTPSFSFNEFDELAMPVGLERFPGETNESFRQRCVDAKSYPGNSSLFGRLRSIDRELGLPPLQPFFHLYLRWNPITNAPYTDVWLNFSPNKCTYQEKGFYIEKESVLANEFTGEIELVNTIGKELEDDLKIQVFSSSGEELRREAYTVVRPNKLIIDWSLIDVSESDIMKVSYPYQEEYIYEDEGVSNTVNGLMSWLITRSTVTDENLNTVSPIVWMNGYFEEVSEIPDSVTPDTAETLEQGRHTEPASGYLHVTENLEDEFYMYVNNYPNKSHFRANQILPIGYVQLSLEPQAFIATWTTIDNMFDEDFINKISRSALHEDKNLKYYAEELIKVARVGIDNALVDRDYWSSDSPQNIGERFLPSVYDSIPKEFPVLTDAGNQTTISLNMRRYLALTLANLRIN